MIDEEGYRKNVGIIIINDEDQLVWAKRSGQKNAWQFPQGGIDEGEISEQALYRELKEELGLSPDDIEVIAETQGWLSDELPPNSESRVIGICLRALKKHTSVKFLISSGNGEKLNIANFFSEILNHAIQSSHSETPGGQEYSLGSHA